MVYIDEGFSLVIECREEADRRSAKDEINNRNYIPHQKIAYYRTLDTSDERRAHFSGESGGCGAFGSRSRWCRRSGCIE